MKTLTLLFVLLTASMCMAQDTPAPITALPDGFATSAGPVAVFYKGEWTAASFQRESYDFLDWGKLKNNHLYIQGVQLEMPSPGVNMFLGGVTVRPDLGQWLKKTNVPEGSLGVFVDANIGNGVSQSSNSHISWLAGGGILYKMNASLAWQPLTVQYGRFGQQSFMAMSTQLQLILHK